MDRIDRSILALCRKMRVSRMLILPIMLVCLSACLCRVAQLETNNFIDGYHANVNAAKMGYDVQF